MPTTARTALATLAALVLLAGAAEAGSWSRSTTVTGPNGGVATGQASRTCAGGTCNSNRIWTGPRGGTRTWTGQTTCGGGRCDGTGTYTGRGGRSWTRTRSTVRN